MIMTPAMSAALALHQPKQLALGNTPEQDAQVRIGNQLRASLTSDNWPKKIKAFRKLFALNAHDVQLGEPLSQLRHMLHRGLFAEEAGETLGMFKEGLQRFVHDTRDATPEYGPVDLEVLAEVVDGILDTVVVGLGWLSELGLSDDQTNLLMQEVHASNMTKVDNSGRPVYDGNGKVLKGDNYVKADIVGLLKQFIAKADEGAN